MASCSPSWCRSLYRRIFEALPEAWIEDPAPTDDTAELLDRHRDRITWDVPIGSVEDMVEQGPGRGQLQYLASLFHPEGPNDLAPVAYNLQAGAGVLPRSPLPPEPHETGFGWGSDDGRRSVREQAR